MKTIFIACFHTLISRNIIGTPVLDILARSGLKVVVLIPNYKKEYFEKTYPRPNVIFEGVNVGLAVRSRMVRIFKRLVEAMPQTKRASLGRRRDFSGRKKALWRYLLFYWPLGVLGKFPLAVKLVRRLDFHLSPKGRFYELLDKYKPVLVFSTDVQSEHDVALMQDARRRGMRIIGMVRSWDNLTTRHLRIIPDEFTVHNEIIKKEAIEITGFPAAKITITGIPHYDKYLRGPTKSREDFFREIGADPQKKLIVYVPICDFRLEDNSVDRFLLEILAGFDANIFVRFPPAERVDLRGFAKPLNMFFDHPGHVFDEKIMGDRDVTPAGDERLANALSFANVVVSGPSTVVIDAALFDRPIILVDFYPRLVKDDERIYEYGAEHVAPLLKSGGIRLAKSKEEFFDFLNDYLAHPEKDHEGRKRIVAEQCWKTDGQSSQRLAVFILDLLNQTGKK